MENANDTPNHRWCACVQGYPELLDVDGVIILEVDLVFDLVCPIEVKLALADDVVVSVQGSEALMFLLCGLGSLLELWNISPIASSSSSRPSLGSINCK